MDQTNQTKFLSSLRFCLLQIKRVHDISKQNNEQNTRKYNKFRISLDHKSPGLKNLELMITKPGIHAQLREKQ